MDELMNKRVMLALESLGSVVIADADGRYLYASRQRLANGGFRAEELLGHRVRDIYPETLVDKVIRTKKPVVLQPMKAQTPKGERQCFVSYYPLLDGEVCLGCFIYTSFYGMSSAMEFTHIVTELSQQLAKTRKELKALRQQSASYSTADIIGQSKAVNQLKLEISMVARTASNVLIQGETGTGKELVAHSIHSLSARRAAPFLRVNCSAIPETLMESEFFGYDDGAFTGAKRGGKAGRFEQADGGSLFLDEVHTLPVSMQPKFLRVLQEREVERVGGGQSIPVNVRVIAATNTSLEEQVSQKLFREDLYYRLNVVKILIPPLRERKEDIPLLVNMFVSQLNVQLDLDIQEVHPDVFDLLMAHSWPGNIRELQNVVERAMNYAYEGILLPDHFHFFHTGSESAKQPIPVEHPTEQQAPEKSEYELLREALSHCGGNKKAAAKYLGWARSTLYEKIKKHPDLQ